jgi:T4-like virus tail tube protein gp19
MAFNIDQFRTNLAFDGARPNLFEVVLPVIPGAAATQNVSLLVKAAQLPGSTVGTVPLYYFGRELKFAGNRTFTDWTVQVINDEDFLIRKQMETWMNYINSNQGNVRNSSYLSPTSYTVDAYVNQFSKSASAGPNQASSGGIIKSYTFVGLFPVDIAPIDLDWGSNDTIEEYSITFAYQYWTTPNTTT